MWHDTPFFSTYMWILFVFFFFSFSFSFSFSTPLHNSFPLNLASNDLVNKTCGKCANESNAFDYNFCFDSLEAIPISHATNLQGLVIVAMELGLENATGSVSSIIKLLNSEGFDRFALMCLEDCLELYIDAMATLGNSIGAFLSGQYDTASVWLSSAMEAATTCEEGFADNEAAVSPLTKENNNLFQLCGIALCSINLLTEALPS